MSSPAPIPTPDLPTSGGAGRGGGRNRNRKGRANPPTTDATATATGKGIPLDPIADVGKHYFPVPGEGGTRPNFKTTSDALKSMMALSPKVKFPQDLDPLFGDEIADVILIPVKRPMKNAETKLYDELELKNYDRKQAKFERHEEALESSMAILHNAIMRQCTEAMQAKVRAQPGYSDAATGHDCF